MPFTKSLFTHLKWIFLFLILSSLSLEKAYTKQAFPADIETPLDSSLPWLLGPLLAPPGTVIPYGSFALESYLYFTTYTGIYNPNRDAISTENHFFIFNPQFFGYVGLTPWLDFNLILQCFYQKTENQQATDFGDLQIALDFQCLDPDTFSYFPGIKFTIAETFPTGSFQRLSPRKLLTDQTGQGSFATTLNLVLYKVYHLQKKHFLSTTYSIAYTLARPTTVHGFNAYGGGFGTNGKAYVGNSFEAIVSFEFAFNEHWVFAIDNVYFHTDATSFSGMPGISLEGDLAQVGLPSSEQISFAPAIEYNFSNHFGIELGCWVSAWGRNSTQFRSAVFNLVYTY